MHPLGQPECSFLLWGCRGCWEQRLQPIAGRSLCKTCLPVTCRGRGSCHTSPILRGSHRCSAAQGALGVTPGHVVGDDRGGGGVWPYGLGVGGRVFPTNLPLPLQLLFRQHRPFHLVPFMPVPPMPGAAWGTWSSGAAQLCPLHPHFHPFLIVFIFSSLFPVSIMRI